MTYFLLDRNRRHFIGPIGDREALYSFLERETGFADIRKACKFMDVTIVQEVDLMELIKQEVEV